MKIKTYKDLIVWNRSLELANKIYELTKSFPNSEIYGLSSQMRRAAVSIPSNISEGFERVHKAEFIHFLSISKGSAGELETQLLIARAQYPTNDQIITTLLADLLEIRKMLGGLISKLSQ
jgi:four helix bundle protein